MISKDHKRHTDLAKPSFGYFGRNEWAIMGTDCTTIKSLSDKITAALSPIYKCAYVDAHHMHSDEKQVLPGHLAKGAAVEYTDHIYYHQVNTSLNFNSFQRRQVFNDVDLILVNGNHHQATSQVIIIDELKRSSLEKRIAQLNNVELILLTDNSNGVFDFLIQHIHVENDLPVYNINETDRIVDFFLDKMCNAKPQLNGLVLAGGKSERMGMDKSEIKWYRKEQKYYLADMMKEYCHEVFISCRKEQIKNINHKYSVIEDSFMDLGPYGAILSAFREKPDSAWMVIACDIPLIDRETISYLLENRNYSVIATGFENPENGNPEPLITIWEPKSYPVLLSFLAQGYSCPKKVLKNSDINLLKCPNPESLLNVNTPEELKLVKQKLKQKITS
jgi:molybdopterin-guanine dinucleotide biosynthesis protein A